MNQEEYLLKGLSKLDIEIMDKSRVWNLPILETIVEMLKQRDQEIENLKSLMMENDEPIKD